MIVGCDADGDGYSDLNDGFPNDPNLHVDSAGVPDDADVQHRAILGQRRRSATTETAVHRTLPDDPTQWSDIDGDGFGDNADGERADAFIADATQWADEDGDGYGDNPTGRQADMFPLMPPSGWSRRRPATI